MAVVNLLNVEELSELFSIPRENIYRLIKAGELPYLRIGKRIRFDESEIVEWLKSKKVRPDAI
jgi:excisionase family DNA binding protein